MEKDKKNMIIIISGILIVLVLTFSAYNSFASINNKSIDENKVNNNLVNNEEIYGYAVISNETVSKIIQLNKSSKDIELFSFKGTITSFTEKHNCLYFITKTDNTDKSIKVMYIDLKNLDEQPVELASGVDVNYYFDVKQDNIFSADGVRGIKKYNIKTKEESYFMENKGAFELFATDSKLYANTYDDDSQEIYYTVDLEGKEFKTITKDEYNNASKTIGYYKGVMLLNFDLIINNKKIEVMDDSKLYNDGKMFYSAKNGREIETKYLEDNNKIAFMEYDQLADSEHEDKKGNIKYYSYDLYSNTISEISSELLYDFNSVIYK